MHEFITYRRSIALGTFASGTLAAVSEIWPGYQHRYNLDACFDGNSASYPNYFCPAGRLTEAPPNTIQHQGHYYFMQARFPPPHYDGTCLHHVIVARRLQPSPLVDSTRIASTHADRRSQQLIDSFVVSSFVK